MAHCTKKKKGKEEKRGLALAGTGSQKSAPLAQGERKEDVHFLALKMKK